MRLLLRAVTLTSRVLARVLACTYLAGLLPLQCGLHSGHKYMTSGSDTSVKTSTMAWNRLPVLVGRSRETPRPSTVAYRRLRDLEGVPVSWVHQYGEPARPDVADATKVNRGDDYPFSYRTSVSRPFVQWIRTKPRPLTFLPRPDSTAPLRRSSPRPLIRAHRRGGEEQSSKI